MSATYRLTTPQPLPVLATTDALVLEGTLAACVTAHALASAGVATTLTSATCSLPFEAVVCRRPWVSEAELAQLPEPFQTAFRDSLQQQLPDGVWLLNLSRLAILVEDLLLDAGVKLFYGMTPCGVARGGSGVAGVIYGGKFGLQTILAQRVVDATATAFVPTLAGHAPQRRGGGEVEVRLSGKVGVADDVHRLTADRRQNNACPMDWPTEASLPADGVVGGAVALHGPYTEFRLRLPVDTSQAGWSSQLSAAARLRVVEVGADILAQRRAAGERHLFFHRFSGALLTEPLFRVAGRPLDNVWLCGPAADVDDAAAARLADPYVAAAMGVELAAAVQAAKVRAVEPGEVRLTTSAATGGAEVELRCADAPPLHGTGASLAVPELTLPVLAECQVLVAGGGTSGVPAALAAGQVGARTVVIEGQADLGGVRSTGGVASYWYGRETPFLDAADALYDAVSDRSGLCEEVAMLHVLRDAGVEVLAGTATVGVARDGSRVAGAVVATEYGLAVVEGEVVVDCTGDADLAAWAGAPFEYGTGRDYMTLWCSFANFNQEKRTASRQYDSAIEIRDPHDFTRTIITGRRRQGMWRSFAHELPQHYVAPRESRRITADAAVTYGGILAGETFSDVMVVCQSNFDIKGLATSDLGMSGVVSSWNVTYQYPAAVPYRATLPQGLDNLLVGGRAYSISHDAQALARMQRDMVALGAGVGIAAARAAQTGTLPRDLDVAALQREWVTRGNLRRQDLRHFGQAPQAYTAADAERDVDHLLRGGGRWQRKLSRLLSSQVSVPALRRGFEQAQGRALQTKFARGLAFLGDPTGVPYLLELIPKQITGGLPRPLRRTLAIPPEHGWAGEPVYSLHAIALAGRGADAAALLLRVAEMIDDDPERFTNRHDSQFEYYRVICDVADRCPGPEMIPALEVLLTKQSIRGLSLPANGDARPATDSVLERRAYLELCLARALARCGDQRGIALLEQYRHDIRGPLARSAEAELAAGVGVGKVVALTGRIA